MITYTDCIDFFSVNHKHNYKFSDSCKVCLIEGLKFYLYDFRAEVIWEIPIWSSCFLRISRRKEWSFVWKYRLGSSLKMTLASHSKF